MSLAEGVIGLSDTDLQCLTNRLYLRFVSLLGYRSVPLKNGYDENLELASLLVHIQIQQNGVSALTRASGACSLRRQPT